MTARADALSKLVATYTGYSTSRLIEVRDLTGRISVDSPEYRAAVAVLNYRDPVGNTNPRNL